jgi:hypothetical protein
MAFVSTSAPNVADDEIGPWSELEYKPAMVGPGFTWGQRVRTIKTYKIYYLVDDTHGETPNTAWTVGGDTYNLRSAGPEMEYLDKHGLYVATYELVGDWADV